MEVRILEQEKKHISVEIKGEDHTFCDALRDELNTDSTVEAAAYRIDHPLLEVPNIFVQVKSGDPKKVLLAAAERLGKKFEGFKKSV